MAKILRFTHMRLSPVLLFLLSASLAAAEPAPTYPLWDTHESVADYAQRVNLPPTKSLDLGNGVKLDLVLIPAGKFTMGTPEPTPVDEESFHKKIVIGQALLASSAGALLVMLLTVAILAIRKRQRPKFSLRRLLMITIAAGGCVLSGLHWRQAANGLQAARLEFAAAEFRYNVANVDEKPAHPVTISKPFYMGKYSVTQEQYQAVIGTNPSHFNGKDNPVEMVSWTDVQVFCKKLTEQTMQTVRLPTEEEWEYACRAGTTTAYNSGDSSDDLDRVGWYAANSKHTTHPVGQKAQNAFGLFDMHGNVWQWCEDSYDDDEDPSNSPAIARRLARQSIADPLRGGSWAQDSAGCRSAYPPREHSELRYNALGFRVAYTAP